MDARERSPWSDAIAAQLRAERAAVGLTQKAMAELVGLPRPTYLRLEKGSRVADISQLGRIADGLGISVVDLMRRAQDRLGD